MVRVESETGLPVLFGLRVACCCVLLTYSSLVRGDPFALCVCAHVCVDLPLPAFYYRTPVGT